MNTRLVAGFGAVLFALAAALPGGAQQSPAPAPAASPTKAPISIPGVPSDTNGIVKDVIDALGNVVRPAYGWDTNGAHGTVTFYRGYDMQVRMQLNKYRDIHLHKGTVINPRGWTIQPGQTVDVHGHGRSDGSLDADVITVHS
jgi:hypothetical protein